MGLFYTQPRIDICMKRKKITIKSIRFSDGKKLRVLLQIGLGFFNILGFSARSNDLLCMQTHDLCRSHTSVFCDV